ncbi:MAG: hypothetical protein ACSLFD_04980 [Solirubrobacterales bacterium]
MPLDPTEQARLRLAIFAALESHMDTRGGFATYDELLNFEVLGRRIPLIDRSRGIRNPQEFDSTLSGRQRGRWAVPRSDRRRDRLDELLLSHW